MGGTVVVGCFMGALSPALRDHAIVAVDVIRSTTTAVTAVASGRRCFPVPSLEAAVSLEGKLEGALLVGELGGNMPYGWDVTNSPAELLRRDDVTRPVILLSSSGTGLMHEASNGEAAYAACLRNWLAQAEYLVTRHDRVALVGAGTRGEFREEDQLCCAWIARYLIGRGYEPDASTRELVDRWGESPVEVIARGKSAQYLRDTGQLHDLNFVLEHVDDVEAVFPLRDGELVMVTLGASEAPPPPHAPRAGP
jgi:2-phosphosulfolactate phosphatase